MNTLSLMELSGRPLHYEVAGLPSGHFAKIVPVDDVWQVWHRDPHMIGEWRGRYASAEAALIALHTAISVVG
jgi:hypothetical protein